MASQAPAHAPTLPALFNPQAGAPAHIAQFFGNEDSNIETRGQSVPSLSPQGKMWTIAIAGQKTKLQRRNADGDMEPLPIMKVVIVDYNKNRGRAYYEGEYDPGKESAPICWSDDGVVPDDSLPGPFPAGTQLEPGKSHKISSVCATCPKAVKGSKVSAQGKAVTACSQHRMVVVTPDPALGLASVPLLRLKIAMTSDFDKQSPDAEAQGWLAFSNYMDWIIARGVKHTAALVTKMKFDPNAAYPKIFFSAERYLSAEELTAIAPMVHGEEVKKLLGGTWTPAGPDGVPREAQAIAAPVIAPSLYEMAAGETFTLEQYQASGWTEEQLIQAGKMTVKGAPPAPEPAPAPAPPPPPAASATVDSTATLVIDDTPPGPGIAAPPAQVVQEPAQVATPAPAPPPVVPDPPAAAAAAAEAAPAVSTIVPDVLADLMKEWT